MAALFFTTQETSIKELFHSETNYEYTSLIVFAIIYFLLACITYGISVPSGLFIPSLLMGSYYSIVDKINDVNMNNIGCSWGRLFGQLLAHWLPGWGISPSNNNIITLHYLIV
jgi:hypothetical protein